MILRLAVAAAMLLLVSACDEPPGLPPPVGEPPTLASIALTPSDVDIADLPEGATTGGRARFRVRIEVEIVDPGSGIDEMRYTIRRPDRAQGTLLATGTLQDSGSRYQGSVDLDIPAGAVGNYQVVVTARGLGGTISNQVAGMLRYRADGSAPLIEEVLVPERITRPADGSPPMVVVFAVRVSDPDGPENIERVVFWNVNRPGDLIEMFDDGNSTGPSGDAVAGDGIFSRAVQITSDNQPGPVTFAFQARDRTGLASEVEEVTVTIE